MSSDPWGRVDETGTVYVRTADGEKVVGSWQAGSPDEALAYFERKYEGLVVEIGLLEKRVKTTDLSAKDATAANDHTREQVDAHHAVGDHVAQGETVGYVGSTGWSTGCHLHFTILVNGDAVDPMNWLP